MKDFSPDCLESTILVFFNTHRQPEPNLGYIFSISDTIGENCFNWGLLE